MLVKASSAKTPADAVISRLFFTEIFHVGVGGFAVETGLSVRI